MQRDFVHHPVYDEFPIYWNVPSFMCLKHGINFSHYTHRFGIKANTGDAFRGENVTILYDPGAYPALLKVPYAISKATLVNGIEKGKAILLLFFILPKQKLKITASVPLFCILKLFFQGL